MAKVLVASFPESRLMYNIRTEVIEQQRKAQVFQGHRRWYIAGGVTLEWAYRNRPSLVALVTVAMSARAQRGIVS
jgi:hypothetical protein